MRVILRPPLPNPWPTLSSPPHLAESFHTTLQLRLTGVTDRRLGTPVEFVLIMKRCMKASSGENEYTETVDIEDLNFNGNEAVEIRARLLEWYDQNRRDLPWRKPIAAGEDGSSETKAYAVWVSEMMLQQTRVQTVVQYYTRWMEKWPTIHHLALASIEEVNEMWAGLGYYRRARFLLEGAKKIVEGGGELPKTSASLYMVNGIGKYTAGAIASIAFGEAVPVVDGNVIRVIARLKAISDIPKGSRILKNFWRLAGELVDPMRPGDFNQAIMELGATVCTPRNASCSTCPISHQCRALSLAMMHESVQVIDYPLKVPRARQRHEFRAVCVVEIVEEGSQCDSRFLLVRRPDEGLLAGLWEFPSVHVEKEAKPSLRRKKLDEHLVQSFGLESERSHEMVSRDDVGVCVHEFSHIHLTMYVELMILHARGGIGASHKRKEDGSMIWKYVDSGTLPSLGLTSGVRKVCDMIERFKQRGCDPAPVNTRKKKRREFRRA